MTVFITKADGTREIFSEHKLLQSLKRSGVAEPLRHQVLKQVEAGLTDGISTEEIYRTAHELLAHEARVTGHPMAARYSIKRAVLELGPSGFPFEQFVAEVLKTQGWKTRTDVSLSGRCAPHEVDILAEKEGKRVGIEVKFHNNAGLSTDVKDALYVKARFEDLKVSPYKESKVNEGWLVTNTRFTKTAIRYGQCANLTMIGWDYPRNRGLLQMIEQSGVHPLTCLTTLTQSEKKNFLDKKIVLCKDIKYSESTLRAYGVNPSRIPAVMREASQVCVLPSPEEEKAMKSGVVDSALYAPHH